MKPGEIYLGRFPFGDIAGMKLRPVLVLSEVVGEPAEVLVAYVSSVVPATPLPSDIIVNPKLPRDSTTNLKTLPVLRLHKLATIHKATLVRHLGILSPETYALAQTRLRDWLRL